ncbi:hypothetical protein [Desulfatibacillum aliphaticivorans]|uniref:hypothetical protein n=1 Tax=Desulfatibacillum aliphaticivorans TaxID=218208 RepID=UPI000400D0D7|nr:hypothetical protein [Desulfatibacillum aliphaticivorans]
MIAPPNGSKIKLEVENGRQKIVIPHPSGGIMRFFSAGFLMFWLMGWAVGWITAFIRLVSGGLEHIQWFLVFWLGGWTIGGIFAFFMLYRMLRPSSPESMVVGYPELQYDPGAKPFMFNRRSLGRNNGMDFWKDVFKKRKKVSFSSEQLNSLKLREFEDGNRLTIDVGPERLDLAVSASEIEREWLLTN